MHKSVPDNFEIARQMRSLVVVAPPFGRRPLRLSLADARLRHFPRSRGGRNRCMCSYRAARAVDALVLRQFQFRTQLIGDAFGLRSDDNLHAVAQLYDAAGACVAQNIFRRKGRADNTDQQPA